MEEKKVTIRVDPETHKLVRRKMEDEFGRDNFQALLVGYLKRYLASDPAQASIAGTTETRPKTVFDELSEMDPKSASEFVPVLQSALKRAKDLQNARPNRVVSPTANAHAGNPTLKKRAK